jgi:hypothetical protein
MKSLTNYSAKPQGSRMDQEGMTDKSPNETLKVQQKIREMTGESSSEVLDERIRTRARGINSAQ